MFRRQKQIIMRTIVLILCLTGIGFIIWSDTSNPNPAFAYSDTSPIEWFLYWTHLSVLGATTWIILSWVGIVFKVEKLNKFVHNQFVKNAVFTFILVTGFVFSTVVYIPLIIFRKGWVGFKLMMVSTTFKHVIIPGSFLFLAIFDGECYKSRIQMTHFRKAMVMFMLPVVWITYVFIVTNTIPGVNPPYLILNFDPAAWAKYAAVLHNPAVIASINISTILGVGAIFIVMSAFVSWLADRNFKKNELTTEIVDELLLKDIYEK